MTALQRALDRLSPGDVLEHLAAYLGKPAPHFKGSRTEGLILDFRPGYEEEKTAGLSYKAGDRGPVFYCFSGKDDFEGGAVALLESVGLSKSEAVALLLEWAGVQDEDRKPGEGKTGSAWTPTPKQAAGIEKVRDKLAKLRPMTAEDHRKALRGFVRVEAGDGSQEAAEVARRGLTPALVSGDLVAWRWVGQEGPEGGPYKTFRIPGQFVQGVLVFNVPGPDGQVWQIKGRNPGSKEDLSLLNKQRYAYTAVKGYGTPAGVWRIPAKEEAKPWRFLIVEGELNGVACWVMLDAARQGFAGGHVPVKPDARAEGWEVQGVGSSKYLPHLTHIPAGAQVYVYADPDEDGEKARETWGELLAAQGCEVFQIRTRAGGVGVFSSPSPQDLEAGQVVTDQDACDYLATFRGGESGAARAGLAMLDALDNAKPWTPPTRTAKKEEVRDGPAGDGLPEWCEEGDVPQSKRTAYGIRAGKLCALTLKKDQDSGEEWVNVEDLASFTARIVAEVIEEDGSGDPRRVFRIEGHRPDGVPMFPPMIEVPTAEFSGMGWAVAKWGGAARLPAGQGKKDKARDALQALSNAAGYPFRTVYQHTGWIDHPEHGHVYLTAGAVIGAAGGVDGVDVELSGRLSAYALPDPAKKEDGTARQVDEVRQAVRASLDLLTLAPDAVGVPVMGAVYRAALGRADFVVWVTGETGRHKTAFMGLAQSHYGARWGRKYLPEGWNSSANAVESNAFRVKDGLFVVDDFKPSGSAAERAKADGTVSRIIQGAADGAGRATLTADRRSRAGLFPRGLVMTSAEDLPRGHSNRARLVIVEVHKRLIDSPAKSAAYFDGEEKAGAGVYALALAGFVQAVAGNFDELHAGSPAHLARVRELSPHFAGAHGRTGDAAAELARGWEVFLSFAVQVGAVGEDEARALWERVAVALASTAEDQGEHLAEADPVARALSVLSGLLAQGRVYLEDLKDGGQPDPLDAALCGWKRHTYRGPDGEEIESYRTQPGAVLLGWTSTAGGDTWAHFLPDALHEALQRAVSGQGGGLLPDASKLWSNMRDRLHRAKLMKCDTEGGRVRATARATVPGGERKKLITLRLPLQDEEGNNLGPVGPVGPNEVLTPTDTLSSAGPTFNIYPFQMGPVGPIRGEGVASSSSPVPDLEDLAAVEAGQAWAVDV